MPTSNVSALVLNQTISYARNSGTAVLVAGTVTISDSGIAANSIIIITAQEAGAITGVLRVSARVVGVSFTITSSVGTDTATIGYAVF